MISKHKRSSATNFYWEKKRVKLWNLGISKDTLREIRDSSG